MFENAKQYVSNQWNNLSGEAAETNTSARQVATNTKNKNTVCKN
jgi:phage-related minor tail protein